MRNRGKSPIIRESKNEDNRWQARDYARTLAEAAEIRSNPEKFSLAREGAIEILNEKKEKDMALRAVALGKDSYSNLADKRGYINPATIGKL